MSSDDYNKSLEEVYEVYKSKDDIKIEAIAMNVFYRKYSAYCFMFMNVRMYYIIICKLINVFYKILMSNCKIFILLF